MVLSLVTNLVSLEIVISSVSGLSTCNDSNSNDSNSDNSYIHNSNKNNSNNEDASSNDSRLEAMIEGHLL